VWTLAQGCIYPTRELEMVYAVLCFSTHKSLKLIIVLGFYVNLPIGAVTAFIIIHIPNLNSSLTDGTFVEKPMGKIWGFLRNPDLVGFMIFAWSCIDCVRVMGAYCWRCNRYDSWFDRCIRKVWCSCFFMGLFSGSLLIFYYLPIYFQAVKNASPSFYRWADASCKLEGICWNRTVR
jgi:hypothetical protein